MGSIRFRSVSVPSGGAAREAAASTLGSISGFPSVAPKARIWRTFLVSILRMSVHQLKREGLHPSTADIVGFAHGIRIFYLLVWGFIRDLSMAHAHAHAHVHVCCTCTASACNAGALRAEPTLLPLYLARSKLETPRHGDIVTGAAPAAEAPNSPGRAKPEDPLRRERRSEKARQRARKRKRGRRRPAAAPRGGAKRGRGQRLPPSRSAQKREGCGRRSARTYSTDTSCA